MIASLATVPVVPSAAFVAVALTFEVDATSPNAASYAVLDTNTRTTGTTPALPTAVVLRCGGGKRTRASKGTFEVHGTTDHDWKVLGVHQI